MKSAIVVTFLLTECRANLTDPYIPALHSAHHEQISVTVATIELRFIALKSNFPWNWNFIVRQCNKHRSYRQSLIV